MPPPDVQRSRFVDYTTAFFGCDDGVAGSPLNPAFVDFTTCTINNAIPDRSEVWDEIQPKVSLRWDVVEQVSLFASWGRGFKSGGFNNLGSQATIDLFFDNPGVNAGLSIADEFDKETSDAFELGFKSTLAGGRAKVEGAVFHTLIDDMQFFNFFVGPFGLLRVVSNIDEASITGGELALAISVTDQISVFSGVSYLDGTIDKNRNRPQTEGNEIPYAPEFTFNIGAGIRRFIHPPGFAAFVGTRSFLQLLNPRITGLSVVDDLIHLIFDAAGDGAPLADADDIVHPRIPRVAGLQTGRGKEVRFAKLGAPVAAQRRLHARRHFDAAEIFDINESAIVGLECHPHIEVPVAVADSQPVRCCRAADLAFQSRPRKFPTRNFGNHAMPARPGPDIEQPVQLCLITHQEFKFHGVSPMR